jgi:hypothetical protein
LLNPLQVFKVGQIYETNSATNYFCPNSTFEITKVTAYRIHYRYIKTGYSFKPETILDKDFSSFYRTQENQDAFHKNARIMNPETFVNAKPKSRLDLIEL